MRITYIIIGLLALSGCSTSKDTATSRGSHALSTEFNILYHGNIELQKGISLLNSKYKDNYWDILPIEKMSIDDDFYSLNKKNEIIEFEIAEKKATKAIQKHSMNIKGIERNPQIDEAFFILGKTRYFSQRFIPAQDAFNYILFNYPNSNITAKTKIWVEKTNVKLGNNSSVIKNIHQAFKKEFFQPNLYATAMATMAEAYLNESYIDSTLICLKIASEATKNNKLKGRYHYILGQLYENQKDTISAVSHYNQVIDLKYKTLYEYVIHSKLKKITLSPISEKYDSENLKALRKLENTFENKPYLDIIRHHIGGFYLKKGLDSLAKSEFKKAIQVSKDKLLKAYSYQYLAKIHFKKNEYLKSGKFYDSTLIYLPKTHHNYFNISKKRDKLKSIVVYETLIKKNDSILKVINLSYEEKIYIFSEYINKIKRADSLEDITSKEKLKALQKKKRNTFYFYNQDLVEYGKEEFKRTWRNIPLTQGWNNYKNSPYYNIKNRFHKKQVSQKKLKYNPDYYINKLPNSKDVDSINLRINNAHYELGIIYKDRFNNFDLAESNFLKLINRKPQIQLKIFSKYQLYRLYKKYKKDAKAKEMKKDILKNHPHTQISEILMSDKLPSTYKKLEGKYNTLFRLFNNQKFQTVVDSCKKLKPVYEKNKLASKFEMLHAFAIGRLYGIDSLRIKLKKLENLYLHTKESSQSRSYIRKIIYLINEKTSTLPKENSKYKLVFIIKNNNPKRANEIIKKLEFIKKEMSYNRLSVSNDVFDFSRNLIVVHGFNTIEHAQGFKELIEINHNFFINEKKNVISTKNFEFLLLKKHISNYK